MTESNPFRPRPDFKKRLVNVSFTQQQFDAFEKLRDSLGFDSNGALIKHALAELVDREDGAPKSGQKFLDTEAVSA